MAIEPVTREERFLAAAGGQSVTPPTPITRKEQLLQGIIDAVKSSGATPDVIEGAVNDYLNANPVQPGATTEQAAQIEQNKTNIADLQEEIEDKQPKGDYVSSDDIPKVPGWAMQASKPAYTASEVGADPKGTAASAVSAHNTDTDAHNDLRMAVQTLQAAVDAFMDVDDSTRDSLSEVLALIDANADVIEAITTSKVSVADIVNNLTTNVANRPLSAAQGVALKAQFDKVPAWALETSKPSYAKSEVGLGNVDNVRQYSASNPPPYPVESVNGQRGAVTVTAAMITAALGYTPINPGKATLGRHTDGLLYLFVDDKPVGSGVELPTGGIDGYITEDKQIVFNNLPDGEYTLAYVMEDGTIVTVGELVKDTNTYYTVTNNLTNCTSSNAETQVVEGQRYEATITANSNYELESVKVTMSGADISSTAVVGGNISISSITGDIIITAVAKEKAAEPTNFFVVGGDGYLNPGRAASNGADRTDVQTCLLSNYIEVQNGDEVYAYGAHSSSADVGLMGLYKADKSGVGIYVRSSPSQLTNISMSDEVDIFTINYADVAYVRCCFLIPSDLSTLKVNIKRNGAWL